MATIHGQVHASMDIPCLVIHGAWTSRLDMTNHSLELARREGRELLGEGDPARLWRPEDCLGLSILVLRVPWAQLIVYTSI